MSPIACKITIEYLDCTNIRHNDGDRMQNQTSKWAIQLGEAVKLRRKALRLNQGELAELAGCQRLFVSEVERGKETVRLDKLVELLHTLGLMIVVSPGKERLKIDESI